MPTVVVARETDLETWFALFSDGADGVVTLPCAPAELLARVLAVIRRVHQTVLAPGPIIRAGVCEIDVAKRRVTVRQVEVALIPTEFSILYLLACNAGRMLARDEILGALLGADHLPGSNIVDRHVRNDSGKLGDDQCLPKFILTVRGGSRLTEHERVGRWARGASG